MEILERNEDFPASYPPVPDGLTPQAAALDPEAVWQRIEVYVSHRWTPRTVTWIVEGEGNFRFDLTPVTVTSVEEWKPYSWSSVTVNESPFPGVCLPHHGTFRITASVGSGTPPAAVLTAFSRLAEYMSEVEQKAGSLMSTVTVPGITISEQRAQSWRAKAMQASGAGDLLRPFRRA